MKTLFAILLVLCSAANAQAYWATRVVARYVNVPVQVRVCPAPYYHTCELGISHIIQPSPYWERHYETRLQYVQETYWVPEVQCCPSCMILSTPSVYYVPTP